MAATRFQSDADGATPQIVHTEDVLGGDPRIEGLRIGVYQIYQRYVEGDETPESIATSYEISVAEVHAALAYAFRNPDKIHSIWVRNQEEYYERESNRLVSDWL